MIAQFDIPNRVIKAFALKHRYAELLADGAIPAGQTDNQFMKDRIRDFIKGPYREQKLAEAITAAAKAVVIDDGIVVT